ncbi:DUF1127 domain-containing protein [Arenibacterium sp. CAU 1754]
MAFATTHITAGKGIGFDAFAWLEAIKTWFTRRNLIRRTFNELSELSDRELDDLGLSRANLKHVAVVAADKALTQG